MRRYTQYTERITIDSNDDFVIDNESITGYPFKRSKIVEHLSQSVRFETISEDHHGMINVKREDENFSEFLKFHQYLRKTFPRCFNELEVHYLGDDELSLLMIWKGINYNNSTLDKPMLLTSHLDVVPAPKETHKEWIHPPFSGHVDDEFIWGRGTIDDKQGVLAILESIEGFLDNDKYINEEGESIYGKYTLNHTIYIAFGHDEEVSGNHGAKHISQWFRDRNISISFMIDEGMTIVDGTVIPFPTAIIGISEKGYVTSKLTVKSSGGHSSLSMEDTVIDILSEAVVKIKNNPMGKQFDSDKPFFKFIQEILNNIEELPLSHYWSEYLKYFGWIIKLISGCDPLLEMSMKTSSASTIIKSGDKENVLPSEAYAMINHRITPGDSIESVIKHDIESINDVRVVVTYDHDDALEPAPISDISSKSYVMIKKTIQQVFPGIVVAPSVFLANSDTRHYWDIVDNIYRFCPTWMTPEDISRFHGLNERISINNYEKIILFYKNIIHNHNKYY